MRDLNLKSVHYILFIESSLVPYLSYSCLFVVAQTETTGYNVILQMRTFCYELVHFYC